MLVSFWPDAMVAEPLAIRSDEPLLPPIPDAEEIGLDAEEWERVRRGEIVVQIIKRAPEDWQARGVGYLRNNPRALFRASTDSSLQVEMFPDVEAYEELERSTDGSRYRARADVSWLLPAFEYEMMSGYDPIRTGIAWSQIRGDFERNEGSQSFLWDPRRRATLAVFTFDLALRGILGLVPERVLLRIAARGLPQTMRAIDDMVDTAIGRDPGWGAGLDAEWAALRTRLERGELPGRVFGGTAR